MQGRIAALFRVFKCQGITHNEKAFKRLVRAKRDEQLEADDRPSSSFRVAPFLH